MDINTLIGLRFYIENNLYGSRRVYWFEKGTGQDKINVCWLTNKNETDYATYIIKDIDFYLNTGMWILDKNDLRKRKIQLLKNDR